MTLTKTIGEFVDREFARETAFLAELVKVPSDNPPGDCAAHAGRARQLLEQLGLAVEAHDVAAAQLHFADALAAIFSLVDAANKHYQVTQPWHLAKDPANAAAVASALEFVLEGLHLTRKLNKDAHAGQTRYRS